MPIRPISRLLAIAFTLALGTACGPAVGTERGACFSNGTCNAGLECASNICVALAAGDSGVRADVVGTDSAPGLDSSPPDDAVEAQDGDAAPADDTAQTDTGSPGTDAGGTRDGASACSGMQCAGFPATFIRGCTNDVSCVGELHQADCCGAIRAMGINHAEASAFCTAEFGAGGVGGCRASYPAAPMCSSGTITTDTGETTTEMSRVATHCANIDPATGTGTCTTYVCGSPGGIACPASRDIGSCG